MKPKNTIVLSGFTKTRMRRARFYAATFPDTKPTAVHKAPSDYPGGKKGDELTVEFTVLGIPVSVPMAAGVQAQRGFSFQIATDNQEETEPPLETRLSAMAGRKSSAVVQGPLGPGDYPRAHRCACGRRR